MHTHTHRGSGLIDDKARVSLTWVHEVSCDYSGYYQHKQSESVSMSWVQFDITVNTGSLMYISTNCSVAVFIHNAVFATGLWKLLWSQYCPDYNDINYTMISELITVKLQQLYSCGCSSS